MPFFLNFFLKLFRFDDFTGTTIGFICFTEFYGFAFPLLLDFLFEHRLLVTFIEI